MGSSVTVKTFALKFSWSFVLIVKFLAVLKVDGSINLLHGDMENKLRGFIFGMHLKKRYEITSSIKSFT